MTRKMHNLAKRTKRKKKNQKEVKKNKKNRVKGKKDLGGDNHGKKNSNVAGSIDTFLMPIELLDKKVRQYIIGQDDQVRKIIASIYRSKIFSSIKANVLIIGNSGTGKTATVKKIAELLDIPYTIEDATKYTQEGYYGADVQDMICNLLENSDGDFARASSGMVIIDEIDKKTLKGEQHDPAGVEVLNSLLKIIEGTTLMVQPQDFFGEAFPFDTENLTIIFMGAFPGLDRIRDARLNRNSFGFAESKVSKDNTTEYTKQDLVKYGLPEEFAGRIDTIIEMNKLGVKELTQILTDSKLSIFRRYEKELKNFGIELEYKQEIFEKIAKKALQVKTGARELSCVVNYIFEKIIFEVFAHPCKYKKCTLYTEITEDNTKFLLS